MDVVQDFLNARREKRNEDAAALLHENASLGSVWGYQSGPAKTSEFLKDERFFRDRSYLNASKLQKIDENTYQRVFWFERMVHEYTDRWGHPFPHRWREVYFVKDGKIALVSCFRQPASMFDWKPFRLLWN
jgi:Txe/YoeB family toxin of Txe-Axe toxin-antitoxin module